MKNFKAKLLGVSLFVLTLTACNHDFDKVVPVSPPPTANQVFKAPKVLYIIADGARGVNVRDADVPNLKSLTPNAIYSWNSLADATVSTDATNWADMITGVKKEKHNVLTEDFAGNNLATYPTIFQRIKATRPTIRIAAFSASAAFKANLTGGTDVSETFATDAALKDRMVSFLATDTASLVIGEFAAIEAAGKSDVNNGFDPQLNAAYKTAITTFDSQLGAILTALKARATYAKENWLIIVASNKGGTYAVKAVEDDKTVLSNPNANTFTIISNPSFNQTFIPKPFVGNTYVGTSIRFLGDTEKGTGQVLGLDPQTKVNLSSYFNFGDTSGFTISVKIKKHKNPANPSRGDYYYQWPGFLGKQSQTGSTTPQVNWGSNGGGNGWNLCLWQNKWRFMGMGGTATTQASNNGQEAQGMEFTGDTWHDLTAVVERKADGTTAVRVYTDGVLGVTNQNGGSTANPSATAFVFGGKPNFDSPSVLRIGYVPGEIDGSGGSTFGKIDVELKELKIFKVAIPDGIVKQYACDQTIDSSHPFFNYLVGYWPMGEGSGTVLRDKGPLAADFTLAQAQTNGYRWTPFTDLICSPVASDLSLKVPKNSDLPTQILSWFNISRQSSWALDGKVWITN
ncbi:DUF4983 domain-containing protein [Mucilaginibacter sp. UYCu711]|uniref:DUF4983 domain-containing protein n=1 Tax=Mucilaginibacter sp. UYCu711 TaxID=3156339 RepID=UPI003D1B35B1